jgi:hypothetical protein
MDGGSTMESYDDLFSVPGTPDTALTSVSGSDGGSDGDSKFELHATYCFVTWSHCALNDHEEFYRRLQELMPEGSQIFGGKEFHEDGNPHYHAVIKFPRRVHWTNARLKFKLEGDTDAIRIEPPRRYQNIEQFLEDTQAYCEKDENPFIFGERIEPNLGQDSARKRLFREIDVEEDFERAKKMIREADPYRFILNYGNVRRYLEGEKKRRVKSGGGGLGLCGEMKTELLPWCVSNEMEVWKERNIDNPPLGRKRSLVLVGDSHTGKSGWAESFGRPIVMTREWNIKNYFEGATHIVVNDVDAKGFGGRGGSYWREVLGCQMSFDACDRYKETVNLKWGIACVWTCNWDQDPRKYPEIAEYLGGCGAVVVEVKELLYCSD